MNRFIFLIFVSTAVSLMSQEIEEMEEPQFSEEVCESPRIHSLNGILLIDRSVECLNEEKMLNQIEGLRSVGVEVPGGTIKLKNHLSAFYGRPLYERDILDLVDAITHYYQDHLRPFVVIEIPKQIPSCVLQLVIIESHLGKVCIEGNRDNNYDRVLSRIELGTGDYVDERILLRDMQFINRNPFRRIDYLFSPGEKAYTTDLLIQMEERRPIRVYVGADNTGVSTTGQQRWFTGFNANITSWADQNISFQYTTSNDFHEFQAYTGQYLMMLPWRHLLNFYGGYSSVHVNFAFPGMTNHGTSYQASGRYIYLLNPTLALNHEVSFGFDFKQTNNAFNFGELIAARQPVNLFQLAAKYAGNFEGKRVRLDYDLEMYWSPGKWLPHQSNEDYQTLRPGAKNHWVYARGALTYNLKLSECWFFFMLRGQFTGENLLPSEQLGIGGYDTVRGYKERQLNKDKGAIANIEIRTPGKKVFFQKSNCSQFQDAVQFLAFFDAGYGSNHDPLPGEPRGEYLLGAGPGVRYTVNDRLTGRLDWGVKLHNREAYGGGWSMFHFSLIASY